MRADERCHACVPTASAFVCKAQKALCIARAHFFPPFLALSAAMFVPPRAARLCQLSARALADKLALVLERDGAAALATELQDAVARLPSECIELARAPHVGVTRLALSTCARALGQLVDELDFQCTLALHDLAARTPAVAQQLADCTTLLAPQLRAAAFEVRCGALWRRLRAARLSQCVRGLGLVPSLTRAWTFIRRRSAHA
jgi:hypothetical protein